MLLATIETLLEEYRTSHSHGGVFKNPTEAEWQKIPHGARGYLHRSGDLYVSRHGLDTAQGLHTNIVREIARTGFHKDAEDKWYEGDEANHHGITVERLGHHHAFALGGTEDPYEDASPARKERITSHLKAGRKKNPRVVFHRMTLDAMGEGHSKLERVAMNILESLERLTISTGLLGTTRSGKPVRSDSPHNHEDFTVEDHADAAAIHMSRVRETSGHLETHLDSASSTFPVGQWDEQEDEHLDAADYHLRRAEGNHPEEDLEETRRMDIDPSRSFHVVDWLRRDRARGIIKPGQGVHKHLLRFSVVNKRSYDTDGWGRANFSRHVVHSDNSQAAAQRVADHLNRTRKKNEDLDLEERGTSQDHAWASLLKHGWRENSNIYSRGRKVYTHSEFPGEHISVSNGNGGWYHHRSHGANPNKHPYARGKAEDLHAHLQKLHGHHEDLEEAAGRRRIFMQSADKHPGSLRAWAERKGLAEPGRDLDLDQLTRVARREGSEHILRKINLARRYNTYRLTGRRHASHS